MIVLPFHRACSVPQLGQADAMIASDRVKIPVRVSVADFVVVVDNVPPNTLREVVCANPALERERSSSGVVVQRSVDQFETFAAWSRARTEKQTVRPEFVP